MRDLFGKYANGTLDLMLQTEAGVDGTFVEDLNISVDSSNFEAIRAELLLSKEIIVNPNEIGIEKIKFRLNLFNKNFPQFKWFGKYYDDYEDYFFSPTDVAEFLIECKEMQSLITSESRNLTLRKLIYAFNKAIEKKLFLAFICD